MTFQLHPDCEKLIIEFAYKRKFCFDKLFRELEFCIDVKNSINSNLFRACVFDRYQHRFVPSPYREFYPFTPHSSIEPTGIWDDSVKFLSYSLKSEYFSKLRSYRTVFERYLGLLIKNGLTYWNILFSKYFIKLENEDFHKEQFLFFLDFKSSHPLYSWNL